MKTQYFYLLLSIIFPFFGIGQSIEPKKLYQEISELNTNYEYEESIQRLESIIQNPKSTHLDKFYAYLNKSLTYKRIFNYSYAEDNLNFALTEGLKTEQAVELQTQILIEKMFIQFDLLNFDHVDDLIEEIQQRDLSKINGITQSFYYNVLAVIDMKNKDYEKAKDKLEKAVEILEKEDPNHLPMVYSKFIGLAEHTKEENMAVEAYNKGLEYANKYKMDIYKIGLHSVMGHFYATQNDFEKAYNYALLSSEQSGKYNASAQSGKLLVLEKQILIKRKDLEIRNERNILIFMSIISLILLVLIIVLYKFFILSKQKRILVEFENDKIRNELSVLSKEINESGEEILDLNQFNLSERQKEIINLVKEGKTNKEIGNQLFISENTVKYHLKIIYNTLGISNRTDL